VQQGEGWPTAAPGEQIGYGEDWPGLAEYQASVSPTKVTVSPTGEVSITTPSAPPTTPPSGFGAWKGGGEPTRLPQKPSMTPAPYPVVGTGISGGKKKARPRPTAPPFPSELGAFLPQGVAGQPIQRGWQMPTPSGQLMGRTDPSTLAKLQGYTQYGGGLSYEDLMARAQRQQPRTPSGIGGRQWGVPRQWT